MFGLRLKDWSHKPHCCVNHHLLYYFFPKKYLLFPVWLHCRLCLWPHHSASATPFQHIWLFGGCLCFGSYEGGKSDAFFSFKNEEEWKMMLHIFFMGVQVQPLMFDLSLFICCFGISSLFKHSRACICCGGVWRVRILSIWRNLSV